MMRLVLSLANDATFPQRVVCTFGGAESVWGNPQAGQVYGQGRGRDYTLLSGESPFRVANSTIMVQLQWA